MGLNPRRTAVLDVLRRMGADVRTSDVGCPIADWEQVGTVTVTGAELEGTVVEGATIPNLIDELPLIAVVGALARGETVIRDARELRVKESDRIATTVSGLRAMGVDVEEHEDGMTVRGGAALRGGVTVKSHGDHRIAMAFAVLALFAPEPVTIQGVACIETSYPGFWDTLRAVTGGG
jgi:3-phosphoshikimate 1-carboxyvinyltransferase